MSGNTVLTTFARNAGSGVLHLQAETLHKQFDLPASACAHGRAGGRACRILRWAVSVEMMVAAAIALTAFAIAYREPLTRDALEFGPEAVGQAFDSYSYDDSSNGGSSTVAFDHRRPFAWTCDLRPKSQWPYCGFGLLFDRDQSGRGIDLRGYERIDLKLVYRGDGKMIRVALKDRDPRYQSLDKPLDKVNQASFPIRNGAQTVPLTLGDFTVAEWWKDQTMAPAELARPSFRNIVSMEIITGSDGKLGPQQFRIERISVERHLVSTEAWFAGIALCWMVLISVMMLHRRRQIARLKRSAEQALRESERLHRGILQASTDMVVLLDPDGRVEFVNGAGVEAMELNDAGLVLGKHWSRLWRDESASVVAAALDRTARGETARFRAFCKTSKGTPKWWDVVMAPMLDDQRNLKGLLTISRDVTQEREQSDQLRWASEHDALTQLPNRRAFQAHLQAATLRAMETGEQIGLLLIDLDHFKHVNDSLGHSVGDELLRIIADRLRNAVRDGDFVARIGGDEFAMIVERVTSPESLLRLGKKVVTRMESPVRAAGRVLQAGASIGGALFPVNARCANSLFTSADTALYALKQNGRGGVRLFDDYMLVEAEKAASQLNLARSAVTDETVVPVYQPKVDLDSGCIVGLEALLRWRHPQLGLQLPATVEEAFSDYELAAKIGELMQHKVAADMREWLDGGVDCGRVSINAAPAEFLRDDYAERLFGVLEKYRIPPTRLEVEVTEHAFLGRGPEYVARALTSLSDAGMKVSLDDFGTGCSSLSHLRDFPVDLVKIDMSFVQQMTENPEIRAIVTAVVKLARSLSIDVVAEGVETPAQLELLRAIGCHMAQGHLFGAAVEAGDVTRLVPVSRAAA